MNFKILHSDDFFNYKNQLIKLYLQAFTQGEYAQFITSEEAQKEWKKYSEIGEIFIALSEEKLIGALAAFPLKYDEYFPKQTEFSAEKSMYVAELMTDTAFQGKGVGTKLMKSFLENLDNNNFSNIVIRVWDKNLPALNLYKKLGFEETGISIQQTKYRSENEKFVMNKIYLCKQKTY